MGQLGQQWFDISQSPPVEYVYNGQSWLTGGASPATTSTLGSVLLATTAQVEAGTAPSAQYVASANDVYAYGQTLVLVAGANIAQTGVTGITNLATNAQAVAGTATVPGVTALAVQPSNLAAVFAAAPTIGSTTPAAATFTALTAVGTVSLNATGTAATTIGGSSGAKL